MRWWWYLFCIRPTNWVWFLLYKHTETTVRRKLQKCCTTALLHIQILSFVLKFVCNSYASLVYHSLIFCFCDVMVSVLDFIVVDLVRSMSLLLEQDTFRWDDDDICFVLDQQTEFDFYCTNSLKLQFAGSYRNVAPLKNIHLCLHRWYSSFHTLLSIFQLNSLPKSTQSVEHQRWYPLHSYRTKVRKINLWNQTMKMKGMLLQYFKNEKKQSLEIYHNEKQGCL
jgi:hypothetical protein